jgi:hypothetical protein
MIEHIVLSGCGPLIFKMIGIIQELEILKTFDIHNIKSIYATSAGSIIGVLLCLHYDWNIVTDYMIKRPWNDLYGIHYEQIFNIYHQCGIYDIQIIKKTLKPLLHDKNISMDITLQQFYDITFIDLHIFTTEINQFQITDLSHLTHPTLPLVTALYMSCNIPILFTPQYYDNKCFTDTIINTIIKNKIKPIRSFIFDLIVLDEAQDITSLYYELICKIYKDNKNINKKICIFGDKKQSIFDFNNADQRFIEYATELFNFNSYNWIRCNLPVSFRSTYEMSLFINKCLFYNF